MTTNERLEKITQIYDNLEKVLNSLPEAIPEQIVGKIRSAILDDPELKEMIDAIKNKRPPRLLMIGNTGHGKSSLINALSGNYIAKVDPTRSCTMTTERYEIKDTDNNELFSILDSRGINESTTTPEAAEDALLKDLDTFTPDAILYVHSSINRDGITEEVHFLKEVVENYKKKNNVEIPVFIVLTRCDALEPSYITLPEQYDETKLKNIEEVKKRVSEIMSELNFKYNEIIVVSSLLGFGASSAELNTYTKEQLEKLEIKFDGRYNIDYLNEKLQESIEDLQAQMGYIAATRMDDVLKRFARKITHSFAGISATIALTPIPLSDVFILCIIQAVLVMIIAALSGREVTLKTAWELVVSFGGVGGLGFGLRMVAQQAGKFLNGIFPGAGEVVSSTVASTGTEAVGNSAIKYYFNK